jgi:hypothetical protein
MSNDDIKNVMSVGVAKFADNNPQSNMSSKDTQCVLVSYMMKEYQRFLCYQTKMAITSAQAEKNSSLDSANVTTVEKYDDASADIFLSLKGVH